MAELIEIWIGAYGSAEEVGVTHLQFDPETAKLGKVAEFT